MNPGDYHSYTNNPDLIRQQLIQFVCRLAKSKFQIIKFALDILGPHVGNS